MKVAGVDGTKGGWAAVELVDGRYAGARLIRPIESAFKHGLLHADSAPSAGGARRPGDRDLVLGP